MGPFDPNLALGNQKETPGRRFPEATQEAGGVFFGKPKPSFCLFLFGGTPFEFGHVFKGNASPPLGSIRVSTEETSCLRLVVIFPCWF